jgi:hypothetical protein
MFLEGRKMKKLLTVVLSLVMLLALSTAALAAPGKSAKVNEV